MKPRKTKQEQYEAELAQTKQQICNLERAGTTTLPIEVAAALLPTKPEYR